MNPDLARLQPYPFEKLRELKADAHPPADRAHIALSIGEPKHRPPGFVGEAISNHMHGLANYPRTQGSDALREAITAWLTRRYGLAEGRLDPDRHCLPVAGTREALFAFAQAVVERSPDALVAMPNPFYQIYEGAALLAGATPRFLDLRADNGFLPDFEGVTDDEWRRIQLVYVTNPGNPTGAVMDRGALEVLIERAQRHDFVIAADECYSEIYRDEAEPPTGLLQAAAGMGLDDFRNCVVFHSLSKRSNLPGLRSGFVAGDADVLARFRLYRTYHGCTLPPPLQAGSTVAWQDEGHVRANRDRYREKFDAVLDILDGVLEVERPDAGFYLWPRVPGSDTEFARRLFAEQNVTVLPGRYLGRDGGTGNPGTGRVRMALVAELEECVEAAGRIREMIRAG